MKFERSKHLRDSYTIGRHQVFMSRKVILRDGLECEIDLNDLKNKSIYFYERIGYQESEIENRGKISSILKYRINNDSNVKRQFQASVKELLRNHDKYRKNFKNQKHIYFYIQIPHNKIDSFQPMETFFVFLNEEHINDIIKGFLVKELFRL